MDATMSIPRHHFLDLNHCAISLRPGTFQIEILDWGFIEPVWWRNYLHVHSFFEVCYAFEGHGVFRIGDREYEVAAGNVFIAKPGEIHEIISTTDDPLGIYFWSYTLSPSKESVVCGQQGIDLLLGCFLRAARNVGTHTPTLQTTLELLTEEIVRKELGYPQVIEALVLKLLLDTARAVVDVPTNREQISPSVRSPEEAVVQVIVRYLRDNYMRPIVIRDLAAQVNLSERHTSRLFQRVLGTSIKEHLTALRLDAATQLLLEGQLPIKEVAQACGYPNVHYFTTLFRQHIGLSPATFRRKDGTRFVT